MCIIVGEALLYNRQSVHVRGGRHRGSGPPLFFMLGIIWPLDCLSSTNQVISGNLVPDVLEISFLKGFIES